MNLTTLPSKDKKQYVRNMFDQIAVRYDFLNHFLSAGIDKHWRKKVIQTLVPHQPQYILDLATGTADLAIAASVLKPKQITGIDISGEMLKIGRQKVCRRKLDPIIQLQQADAENLPFNDNSFDAATVAFGVRNFEELETGLREVYRVLKPGATFVVLEFSRPRHFPVKQFFSAYFKYILPTLGRLVSRNKTAYTYLPESVSVFPDGEHFIKHLSNCGFTESKYKFLSFGIACLYSTKKPQ